jgi:hypothetical protein
MILLGIKSESASGSSTDSYGFGGFSINATSVVVLKEGTKNELREYVNKTREKSVLAGVKLNMLQDMLDEDSTLSVTEFDKLYHTHKADMYIDTFERLLIIEGEVL